MIARRLRSESGMAMVESVIVLPVLLVAGLATRFSALGILAMTAVIQLTIPDGWANFHLPWAAMAAARVRTALERSMAVTRRAQRAASIVR